MKGTETGKDKVKKICDILRRETLDPAISEAEQIVHLAKERAEEIVASSAKRLKKSPKTQSLRSKGRGEFFSPPLGRRASRQSVPSSRKLKKNCSNRS